MSPAPPQGNAGVAGFRRDLLLAMMVIVSAVAAATLLFTQHNMARSVREDFERQFQSEVAAMQTVQAVRHAVIAERCRALARKPRIHAALEDGAPDLLYPSARDELADVTGNAEGSFREPGAYALRARYYRFLDAKGRVIPPPDTKDAGELDAADESKLSTGRLSDKAETGYVRRDAGSGGEIIDEVIAVPIVSSEDGATIAAIVLGFKPPALGSGETGMALSGGIWIGGHLVLPAADDAERTVLGERLDAEVTASGGDHGGFQFTAAGAPYLAFFKRLNPGSLYPAAYGVSVLPLAESVSRQRRLGWEFAGVGALVLLAAYGASHVLSGRLSRPVERLAVDSEENRARRRQAEEQLKSTSLELQRSARFSADASHQLKTPVTVLRSGLEELLAGENLKPDAREEVAALVHQTFRLASVIEDLLLLSRMDAGRLQIQFSRIDLAPLFEGLLDDIRALPDVFDLEVEEDIPPSLWITGEKRYATLILQNLLENARKYNHAQGRIRIAADYDGDWAVVTIGNTGSAIPAASHEHIFERFHRGAVGENVPGHGIGLNLARELARLHGGDLKLSRSDVSWTEFELRLRLAEDPPKQKP